MDCDTTGIEPDFALVKFKKLAGGGYFKIINQSLVPALENLGYSRPRSRTSSPTPRVTARCSARRRSTTRRSQPRASPTKPPKGRVAAQAELRPGFPFSAGPSARSSANELGFDRQRGARAARNFDLLKALGFTARRSRPPTTTSAAR
jgi:hypothetical protein